MAIAKPEVEWFYDRAMERRMGLLNLAGKWAVVKAKLYYMKEDEFHVVTDWLNSREEAIGFLKLLKEN
jgi:hypothetical protein